MTMVQPVLQDDPFAAPAWNASGAILALEKLRSGEQLDNNDRRAITKTEEFLRSLQWGDAQEDDLSDEARRNQEFLLRANRFRPTLDIVNLHLQFEALISQLEASAGLNEEVLGFVPQMQDTLLDVLHVLNICRQR
ncbi:hypothetical protein C4552_02365 [Candidatus Parcubacteria bacterium]|nr:MAG: hypothetical protein C4552_02365 [Candidatus Parcubacteria bacterium]